MKTWPLTLTSLIAAALVAGACVRSVRDPGSPGAVAARPEARSAARAGRAVTVQVPTFPDRRFVVTTFGAIGDGQVNDSPAIDRAIEACNAAGGGTVYFPPGTYMAASIHLRSNVRLHIDAGATLKALARGYDAPEPNPFSRYQDFGHSHFHNALIWGENLVNVAIEGPGTVDGSALSSGDPKPGGGDKQIALKSSERILFRNLRQTGGGHFFYLLTDCRHVTMASLDLHDGRDGIDLVGCSHADLYDLRITECHDDTIALKSDYSTGKRLRTENIQVWNSTVESGCNGLQFGSETAGDFRDVHFRNIQILRAGKAGIGLQTNDGGVIEDVSFENITIRRAANPIFINTTSRLRTPETVTPGRVRRVRIRNVTATEVIQTHPAEPPNAATISGLPGVPHEDILLENVSITYQGGGTHAEAVNEPAYPKNYNPRKLGPRPAYGFFVRHAKNLVFRNVTVGFAADDLRPAWVVLDVDGLTFDGITAQRTRDGESPALRIKSTRKLTLRNSPALPTVQLDVVDAARF